LQTTCVDTGDNPTVTVVTPPIGGTLPALPGLYTPAPGFHGVDHLVYTVKNTTTGETSEQTTINIVVNTQPTCSNGTATTSVNTPVKLAFPCNDPDGDSVLIRAENGQHGTVDPSVGTTITYTPEAGYIGTDEIEFVGMEGAFTTPTRKLTITVTATATPTATASPEATATPSATVAPAPTATPTPIVPGATDTAAPSITVKATGKPSISKGVTFAVTSNEAGSAKLTLAVAKQTVSKSSKLVSGTTKVVLKLSAKARKALRAKKSVKGTLTVVASDGAGNRATKKLSVTLKR
jgi:hypothetical protein